MLNCNYLRKTPKERRIRRISQVKEFYLVRWNEYHFSAALNLLKFHQFGSTVLPETLLEYVWYAEGEVWKGTLMVADLEQVDKNRRVRISRHIKLNARRWSRPYWWQYQEPQMDNLKFIGGDQVLRTPTLTRYHPSSRRSSRDPSWRIRRVSTDNQSRKSLHINTVYTENSDILTKNCFEHIWENLSWTASTSRLTPSLAG